MSRVSALILAGQREGVVDPLCAEAGVARKAIIPILGKPMITYVLDALDESGLEAPYYVSGFDAGYDPRLTQSPSAPGPASSAVKALEAGIPLPALITTCDHALLTPEMVRTFISGAQAEGADFCLGLAEKRVIQPAYPETKRTYLKFRDTSISGCNLFYIANEKGLEAIRFWETGQHLRKQPLKLAAALGPGILMRYVSGRLSVRDSFDYAGQKLGISAAPIFIPIAEAAIDVDKPSDKVLVEAILTQRQADRVEA